MADDSIDDIDFDDSGDEQDDIEYEDSFSPSPKMSASNASPHFSPGFRIQVHL